MQRLAFNQTSPSFCGVTVVCPHREVCNFEWLHTNWKHYLTQSPQCVLWGFVLTGCKWLLSLIHREAGHQKCFSLLSLIPLHTSRENVRPPFSLPDFSIFPNCKPDKRIVRQICCSVIQVSSFQKSSIKFQSLEPFISSFRSFLLVNTFLIIRCPELYHLITLQVQFPGAVFCDSRAFETFLPFTGYLRFQSFISRHLVPSYFKLQLFSASNFQSYWISFYYCLSIYNAYNTSRFIMT